jgi:LuxR family maltose regulon positive regulatory protein
LETLATLQAELGELHRALELYQNILSRDPYRESAYRGQMLCYYRLGDRASAVRQYQTCVALLRDELGASPAPETNLLFLEITG